MFSKIRGWLRGLVSDLPPETNFCETDCEKTVCDDEHFTGCARRLKRMVQLSDVQSLAVAASGPSHPTPAPSQALHLAPPAKTSQEAGVPVA